MCSVMKEHAALKNAHYLKFVAFVKKNTYAPFYVKRQVFRACIMSTLLYSSEVWLGCIDKKINKIYMSCIRSLLDVRNSTDTDLCLHEIMMPSIEALVYEAQRKYLTKVRDNAGNHPLLCRILEMGRNVQLASGHITKCKILRHIDKILSQNNKSRISQDINSRRDRIVTTTKTKSVIYKQWCPTLAVHDVYITRKFFPEHWRISWTRFRLSATNLPCEKNRWNQNRNRVTCICGEVQTESHILLFCEERLFREATLEEIFNNDDQRKTMKLIHETLEKYEVKS